MPTIQDQNEDATGTKPTVVLVIGTLSMKQYILLRTKLLEADVYVFCRVSYPLSTTFMIILVSFISTDVTALCLAGMAGSGKTTLMQQIEAQLHDSGTPSYILNLDPAVYKIPYSPNVDIRDTVRILGVF
jgi:ABC-type glutathione transport system ATPase component